MNDKIKQITMDNGVLVTPVSLFQYGRDNSYTAALVSDDGCIVVCIPIYNEDKVTTYRWSSHLFPEALHAIDNYLNKDKQTNEPRVLADGEVVTTQDPKYVIIGGTLCNAFTKEPIPEDEPVFILRAKDIHAYSTLDFYVNRCTDEEHKKGVEDRMLEFDEFKSGNDDLMGEPDTLSNDDFVESTQEGDNTSL